MSTKTRRATRRTDEREPVDVISLRLARIVHRLITDPSGWLVSELRADLGIEERTFRKYKLLLARNFEPFFDASGTKLQVVPDRGPERRLKLVSAPNVSDKTDFVMRLASHHVVSQLLGFMGDTRLAKAIDEAEQEFRARVLGGPKMKGLRSSVDYALRNLDRLVYCVPDAPKDYRQHADTIEKVLGALTTSRRVKLRYPAKRGLADHLLEPLTLALWRSGLYLFARYANPRKGQEDSVYVFALDRIRDVEVLQRHFTYPSPKEWDPAAFTEASFGIFTPASAGKQPLIAVELIFANTRWLKDHVSERRWAKDQQCTHLPDGRMRLSFRVNSLETLIHWVCQWPGQIEVVKPPELARRVAAELGR